MTEVDNVSASHLGGYSYGSHPGIHPVVCPSSLCSCKYLLPMLIPFLPELLSLSALNSV